MSKKALKVDGSFSHAGLCRLLNSFRKEAADEQKKRPMKVAFCVQLRVCAAAESMFSTSSCSSIFKKSAFSK